MSLKFILLPSKKTGSNLPVVFQLFGQHCKRCSVRPKLQTISLNELSKNCLGFAYCRNSKLYKLMSSLDRKTETCAKNKIRSKWARVVDNGCILLNRCLFLLSVCKFKQQTATKFLLRSA